MNLSELQQHVPGTKLDTGEVAQLIQLSGYKLQGVDHGSVISKTDCAKLVVLGLCDRLATVYRITELGLYWLSCAGIKRMVYPA
jgi:hypothetical protein